MNSAAGELVCDLSVVHVLLQRIQRLWKIHAHQTSFAKRLAA